MAGESATSTRDLLMRAAVLSVFDVDWIYPHLADDEVDDVVEFLASSCERVIDVTGRPRWRLRDDERIRVLREFPRASLQEALDGVAARPDDLVQTGLEHYLSGSFPPVDQLDATELTGVLQLERWVGEDAGLPAASDVQARLDWLTLVEPLQRLVTRGFFGRKDLLAELRSFTEREAQPTGQSDAFLIEGMGGSGKSTALARFILDLPAQDHLKIYISFDRGWLIDGGPWTLFDEIVRQVGAQLADRRDRADALRRLAQAGPASEPSEIASRGSQRSDPVAPGLLENLGRLVHDRERVVVVLDTLEELARRDESFAHEIFGFLTTLSGSLTKVRVIAAGRSLPSAVLFPGRRWPLTGLDDSDALKLLQRLTVGTPTSDDLFQEIIRLAGGNPLSLHLAADVLKRTGDNPTRLIAVAEGNVQGQLYSRLLEHIRDPRVRAVAHPGLVVRRLTPEIIRDVLAEPCRIAPLDDSEATQIFMALRDEATLCEPSRDGDGALVHRPDVRALMLPSIQQDSPGTSRAIHEAAVRYYEAVSESPAASVPVVVSRREELYHRLMLAQERSILDDRWDAAVASDLAAVIDELPLRSQLYLTTRVQGLRLDTAALMEADDDEWQNAVRPSASRQMEGGRVSRALELIQERRGRDGRPLLPDLEIEALERLGRVQEALSLAEEERERASRRGAVEEVRALTSQEARILERMRRWDEAWTLLADLVELDRDRRARTSALDDEVRVRELIVLTSMLRIARHEMRPDRPIDELTRETVDLAEATPPRLLTANRSLLRDLAAEIGPSSPQILQLAVSTLPTAAEVDVLGVAPASTDVIGPGEQAPPRPVGPATAQEVESWTVRYRDASDASQGYLRVPLHLRVGVTGHRFIGEDASVIAAAVRNALGQIDIRRRPGTPATPVELTVVSALAEGADRLVARQAMQRGASLEVVLPLPREDYLADFMSEESKAEFQALLGRAAAVTELAEADTREEAYERAGRMIVDRSDVLLALWDDQPAQGRGGTAETVSYARQQRVPVLRVAPGPPSQDPPQPWPVDGQDLPEVLGPLSDVAFARLDQFNSTSLDTRGRSSGPVLLPPQAEGSVPPQVQLFVDYAQPYFRRAEQIAVSSQRRFLRLTSLLYVLAALAVVMIATQIFFFPSDPRLAWVEVATLAALVVTLLFARRAPWQDRWIAARYLADRIRSGVFLASTGAADALQSAIDMVREPDPNREWAERAFREISYRAPRFPVEEDEVPGRRDLLVHAWIDDQIRYHRAVSSRLVRRQRRLNWLVVMLFGIGALATLFHSVQILVTRSAPDVWGYLAVTFPAVGAALSGYGAQRQYGRLAGRSRQMVVQLVEARELVLDSNRLSSLQEAARQTDLLMRSETAHSYDVVRQNDLQLPA